MRIVVGSLIWFAIMLHPHSVMNHGYEFDGEIAKWLIFHKEIHDMADNERSRSECRRRQRMILGKEGYKDLPAYRAYIIDGLHERRRKWKMP